MKILKKKIETLRLEDNVLKILKANNIKLVGDLWCLNRNKLKKMGLMNPEISHIIIKLQLCGIDLNKRVY
ncbi:MAG: hypothetical protein GX951_01630 [Mollicutes bacterium]|nr:hypothetical protein [Mollicutes bacterium]